MSCPFDQTSLDKLKTFINICTQKPELVHLPQLEFFKNYLLSLGAALPPEPEPEVEQVEEEKIESEPESDLELDMEGCVEPDVVSPDHVMGDSSKVPSEEETDKADEKRMAAMSEFSEGKFDKAIELFTEAIELNPTSAVNFVKRGQSYLKLNKPNACIRDCTQALELNPDSATGYKFRGRAYRLIGEWENAARDLRQACEIDFDEQTDEWLKEVTPNAQKIIQHKMKQEMKKTEKGEKERLERIKKAKEAHAEAAEAQAKAEAGGDEGLGAGAGAAGLGDFYKLFEDPEVMSAIKDPEVAAAFRDISTNTANFAKYQSNPKVVALITKLTNKFQRAFPGMGGFPEGFPGAGGFNKSPTEDDGLD